MIIPLIGLTVAAVIGYFILLVLSTNLLGFFVRGLYSDPHLDALEKEASDLIKEEVKKSRRADMWANITAVVLLAVYFYALFHFLNIFAIVAVVMIMVSRIPDLIWEIKHGKKINVNTMKRDWVFYTTTLLDWIALPIFWYALYSIYFF